MFWASIIIMVAGFIGLIVCSKKQKVNPAMQPLAFGCMVVVLIGLGLFIYNNQNEGKTDLDSEISFMLSKSAKAGSVLAKNFSGKKVLFIVYPEQVNNEMSAKKVEAFKATYGENADVTIASITPPKDYNEGGIPLEELMRAKDFDALLAKYPDVGVIVSELGLPGNANSIKALNQAENKRPVVFLLQSGPLSDKALNKLISSGKVVGIVMTNTKADWNKKCGRDLLASFDIRYRVIEKSNLAELK